MAGTLEGLVAAGMIETAEQLLAGLQADVVFAARLGTYHFDNGDTAPALTILRPNQSVEGVERIEGIECIIGRYPDGGTTPFLTGGHSDHRTWRIWLIEYEGSAGITEAADRIAAILPGSTYSDVGTPDLDMIAGLGQVAIVVPAHAMFADYNGPDAPELSYDWSWDGGAFTEVP